MAYEALEIKMMTIIMIHYCNHNYVYCDYTNVANVPLVVVGVGVNKNPKMYCKINVSRIMVVKSHQI